MSEIRFRKWGAATSPCHGCTERTATPNCHGQNEDGSFRCERFGAFRQQHDAEYAARKEFVRQNDEIEAVMRKARKK